MYFQVSENDFITPRTPILKELKILDIRSDYRKGYVLFHDPSR